MTRKLPAFKDRFAFMVWLRLLMTGECPTNAEIARELDVTGPAVTAWRQRIEAPSDRRVIKGLLAYFGIPDCEAWFADGEGESPRPDLWLKWWDAQHANGPKRAETHGSDYEKREKGGARKAR